MSADLSRHARRVALVTACGAKKRAGTWPLHLLYQSTRIKAIYGRKGGFSLFILSAQYGLVDCEQERPSYDRLMNMQRAEDLRPESPRSWTGTIGWSFSTRRRQANTPSASSAPPTFPASPLPSS